MKQIRRIPVGILGGIVSVALWASIYAASAQAQEITMGMDCPPMKGYGPFDYRTITEDTRILVEGAHFTPEVEQLISGKHSYIGGDIDYTLRAFPNSPRALLAMMRLADRQKTQTPEGAKPLHCYFENALIFKPDDSNVRMLYGMFLLKNGDKAKAVEQLEKAAALNDDDPNIYYNLGLVYFDMKKYDLALADAHRAYAAGFPLPGLRDKLKRAGQWHEPAPKVEETSAPLAQPLSSADSAVAK